MSGIFTDDCRLSLRLRLMLLSLSSGSVRKTDTADRLLPGGWSQTVTTSDGYCKASSETEVALECAVSSISDPARYIVLASWLCGTKSASGCNALLAAFFPSGRLKCAEEDGATLLEIRKEEKDSTGFSRLREMFAQA